MATSTAAQVLSHGFLAHSDPDRAIEESVEVCFKCGTQLVNGDCPACLARWQDEQGNIERAPREWVITDMPAPFIIGGRPDTAD